MTTAKPDEAPLIRLTDYQPTPYAIETVRLDFDLHPDKTRVRADIGFVRRAQTAAGTPLVLDGDGLTLTGLALDGTPLAETAYAATPDRLSVYAPPADAFTLTIETLVDPDANSALMGLYRSGGVYTTQCEAEGFRRITYFHDRPDVLAVYTVRLAADKATAPVLLSNGNRMESGDLADGRHFAVWHDPHPKPSYLFAVVAGDLGVVTAPYTTADGRDVALAIYCEHGKEARCGYAMDALIRSMRWDEERFGRNYDLDVFNIVAVSDFNMGAMENKGLNVFNDKYVLVDAQTGTDADHAGVETVIAHEYFHNWTGNRITCRDWFQLCLKEGLTVFRDQEFSADTRSRPVKRIADVTGLRRAQFPEDGGPLAHPVRPDAYREINNFYTATVYQKGAEVCRMLEAVLGRNGFAAGMALYFERHDGQATTIEHFLSCFADATQRDLTQFALWYEQAGTPAITARHVYDADAETLTLDLEQVIPDTPGQRDKKPMHIPIRFGLVGPDGQDLSYSGVSGADVSDGTIHLTGDQAQVRFEGVRATPVPSLLRGFSAPVRMDSGLSTDDLLFLVGHDRDPFNRFEAAQRLALDMLVRASANVGAGGEASPDLRLAEALGRLIDDDGLEPAFRAQAIALPGEMDVAEEIGADIDPDAIHKARQTIKAAFGEAIGTQAIAAAARAAPDPAYSPDAGQAGRRALTHAAHDLAFAGGQISDAEFAGAFAAATNLTDRIAPMRSLVMAGAGEALLAEFYDRYKETPLVLDKWFALQAMAPGSSSLDTVIDLTRHPAFSMRVPNRVYSLIRTFGAANPTGFNRADGAGYRFMAEAISDLDGANPNVAARLATCFRSYAMLESGRRGQAHAALEGIAAKGTLSRDVADIVGRILAG